MISWDALKVSDHERLRHPNILSVFMANNWLVIKAKRLKTGYFIKILSPFDVNMQIVC